MGGDDGSRATPGRAIVHLRGDLDLGTVDRAQRELHTAVDRHPGELVVIDLDGVTSIDSAGLGVLVGALGRATSRAGDVELVCSSDELRAQLQRCRLDRVFVIRSQH